MAQRKKKELTLEQRIEDALSWARRDLEYCPEPTYSFEIGTPVKVGHLKDAVVVGVYDDGKTYLISYTEVVKNGDDIHDQLRGFLWYDVRPLEDEDVESFIENEDVQINFANMEISSLISKVLHFGVDFNPDYQRDLVWTQEDKEALIDSIFKNIDIGKFCFIHLGYSGFYGYQILDGKQRLTAIMEFYLNKFPYKGKFYNELSYRDRRWFTNRQVAVGEMRDGSQELILKYFLLLNTTGHVVSDEHLQKVRDRLRELQE